MTETGFDPNATAAFLDPGHLPAAPELLLQFLESIDRSRADVTHIASLTRQDPALCFRVLSLDSTTSRRGPNLAGLDSRITHLGLPALRSLGAAMSRQTLARRGDHTTTGGLFEHLWEESHRCAHAAREIARLVGYDRPEDAYLAGLLHNLGRIQMLHHLSDSGAGGPTGGADPTVSQQMEETGSFAAGPGMAAQLTRAWRGLPFFSDALLYQEEPPEAVIDAPPLVKLVNLARRLSVGQDPEKGRSAAARLFGLAPETADDLRCASRLQAEETAIAFGIRLPTEEGGAERRRAVREALDHHLHSSAALEGLVEELHLPGRQSPWQVMLRHLDLVFGLPQALAFAFHPSTGTLEPVDTPLIPPDHRGELCLSLRGGRSLAARAVLQQRPLFLEDREGGESATVVDRQLRRLLGTPALFCLPLIDEEGPVGVLVAGADQGKCLQLDGLRGSVERFARSCARGLESRRRREALCREKVEDQAAGQQLRIRGLVHEANNPLGVIRNYIHILSLKLTDRKELQGELAVVNDEIGRVAEILERMKTVEPAQPSDQGMVDINRMITDLTSVWRSSLLAERNIAERLLLQQDIPPFSSCADSLKQILTNLVKNAVEAMGDGGNLTIASRAPVNVNGRPHVEISVADSGPGLPREVLERAFTPRGGHPGAGGRGLGLTIVGELASSLQGLVSCSNRSEGGAEFILRVPHQSRNPETVRP